MILLLLAATGARAAEPPPEPAITVTGTLTAETLRDRAATFVKRTLPPPVDGQYARWNVPVCPKVIGIAETYQHGVIDHMLRVIRDSGAAAGKPGCKPNVVVTFSADAAALVRSVTARQPHALDESPAADRTALLVPGCPCAGGRMRSAKGPTASPSAAVARQWHSE